MRTLVLGLGNDILGDDAAGIFAARALKLQFEGVADVDVVETALHGVALLDLFLGYDRAVLVDAIQTGKVPPGSLVEVNPDELVAVESPSPHYAGVPELLTIAKQLDLDFPTQIRIFAVEAEDLYTIGGSLSPAVENALEGLVAKVAEQVTRWQDEPALARA